MIATQNAEHFLLRQRKADALKLELFNFRNVPYITDDNLKQGKQYPSMDGRQVFVRRADLVQPRESHVD